MMEFKEKMEKDRRYIEEAICRFLDSEEKRCPKIIHTRKMFDSIREFTLRGGKRIRAILLIEGYRSVGGRDIKKALKASVAMELIQTMLLVHDDVIDRSSERRGGPSLHRIYQSIHRENAYNGDEESFGINMAIIGGDLAESLGEKSLIDSGFPPDRILEALSLQSDMIRDTGFGQILDILSEVLPEWSEAEQLDVQKYKTARYTLEGPLVIGASLHGATKDQMRVLSEFATPVGISFQIIDDILGFYGDPRRGGSKDLSDIKEGKRTLLILKSLEIVNDEDAGVIRDALGNENLTVEEANRVRSIIRECGSEDHSRKMAQDLNMKGIKALEGSDLDPDVIDFLKDLASYLLFRA